MKLYLTCNDLTQVDLQCTDPTEMKEKLALQKRQLAEKDEALKESGSLLENIQHEMIALQSQYDKIYKNLKEVESSNSLLKKHLKSQKHELNKAKESEQKVELLRTKVTTLEKVQKLLKGRKDEIRKKVLDGSSTDQMATMLVGLKADYDSLREKKANVQQENEQLTRSLKLVKKELKDRESELFQYQNDLNLAEEERQSLQKKIGMLQAAIDSPGSRHTLKRMLESPMPDQELNGHLVADVGASPQLLGGTSGLISSKPSYAVAGIKRMNMSRENVVMPLPKMKKPSLLTKDKSFSSQSFRLKFAPRNKFLFKK